MKTALVTGASGGIGKETALLLWEKGANVIFHYFSHGDEVSALAAKLNAIRPRSALALSADLRKKEEVDRLFSLLEREFESVDVLVNNAGISSQRLFTDITEEEWDDMFAVHVKAAFLCCQRALPKMIYNKQGSIINLSSIWGQIGGSCEVHYSAAKGALIAMTKALAMELAPSGIRVNAVAPGMINTPMNNHLSAEDRLAFAEDIPLGREGTPKEVANAILFLASEQSSYLTGQVISPNGGLFL